MCRLTKCVGCNKSYTKKHPCTFVCDFQCHGFPFRDCKSEMWAAPCEVSYHAECIKAGEPFCTRLPLDKGLICPSGPKLPHFICELCQVRGILNHEVMAGIKDLELLLMERMRLIDSLSPLVAKIDYEDMWPLPELGRSSRKCARMQRNHPCRCLGTKRATGLRARSILSTPGAERDDLGFPDALDTMSRILAARDKPLRQRCTSTVNGLSVEIAAGKPLI
jgi:hypothetical protein